MTSTTPTIFGITKELLAPTGITKCCFARLLTQKDLVVVRSSIFQIYSIVQKQQQKHGFELVYEQRLNCTEVESIVAISPTSPANFDLLLMTTTAEEAGISVLAFDTFHHQLRVVSLHSFTKQLSEATHLNPFATKTRGKWLKADPIGRCVSCLISDNILSILSFETDPFSLTNAQKHEQTQQQQQHSTTLSPSSFLIKFDAIGILNVIDMSFLAGYSEPTLLVLHQPRQTWAGRLAIVPPGQSTCIATAISINSIKKTTTTVWQIENLPYSCDSLLPLPPPIGGSLVFTPNSVMVLAPASIGSGLDAFSLNKSFAFNEFGEVELRSCFQQPLPPNISLPSATKTQPFVLEQPKFSVVLNPMCSIISTKTGAIFSINLALDGTDVRGITVDRIQNANIPSCMTLISDEKLLFIGSRFGDSLLIRYQEETEQKQQKEEKKEPDAKRSKIVAETDRLESLDEFDDAGFYTESSTKATTQQSSSNSQLSTINKSQTFTKIKFSVEDHLIGMGCVRDLITAESTDLASSNTNNASSSSTTPKPRYEIVACTGTMKSGALHVLQSSIRLETLAAFDFPDCLAIFPLLGKVPISPSSDGDDKTSEINDFHSFLLVAKADGSTMAFSTVEELEEITYKSQFNTNRTFAASNVIGRELILQIHPTGAFLLENSTTKITEWTIPQNSAENNPSPTATLSVIFGAIFDPFAAMILSDGSLQLISVVGGGQEGNLSSTIQEIKRINDSNNIRLATFFEHAENKYLAVIYESEKLEFFRLPQMESVFLCDISNGDTVLYHNNNKGKPHIKDTEISFPIVSDFMIKHVSKEPDSPLIITFALNNNQLLIYRGFKDQNISSSSSSSSSSQQQQQQTNKFPFRFSRINHQFISITQQQEQQKQSTILPKLVNFQSATISGIAFCGNRPAVIVDDHGFCRVVPMDFDGAILCMAPLRTSTSPKGFIYCTPGRMKIGRLANDFFSHFERQFPAKRVPLKSTPERIAYYQTLKAIIVGVTQETISTPESLIPPEPTGPLGEPRSVPPPPPRSPMPAPGSRGELRLINSGGVNWETSDAFQLEEHEHCASVRVVNLVCGQGEKPRQVVVIGTTIAVSEAIPARGRILVIDVIKPTIGKLKFKSLIEREYRGPVMNVNAIDGVILATVGPRVVMFSFGNGSDLVGLSFYEAQLTLITTMIPLRNWILIGDAFKGASFLQWRADNQTIKPQSMPTQNTKQLSLLGRDYRTMSIHASEYLVDQKNLGLLVSDEAGNAHLLTYSPDHVESRGGQMLFSTSDVHIGSHPSRFIRLALLPPPNSTRNIQRSCCIFGTYEGGISEIRPIDENIYKIFSSLETCLSENTQQIAGLVPQKHRIIHGNAVKFYQSNPKNNITWGDFIMDFFMLPFDQQLSIAKQANTNIDFILKNLSEIVHSTNFFI